jgi:hypothetical protein
MHSATPCPRHAVPLALATLTLTGCLGTEPPPLTGRNYIVLVDQSGSGRGQEDLWWRAADTLVLQKLDLGDSLVVFGVHNATAEAAPLLDEAIPHLNPDEGMPAVLKARKKLAEVKKAGAVEIRRALAVPVRASGTQLIESLKRLRPSPRAETIVLFLSDMLESSRLINLERTRIADANLAQLAQKAVDEIHLAGGSLAGAQIHCVLNSRAMNSAAIGSNSREMLERFWRTLFEFGGAVLVSFDSRIQ